jgi:hypothetical protein
MINVILKSFESCTFDRIMAEKAFQGIPLGTCISITNDQKYWPALDAQEHIWMPGAPLRNGRFFADVDWNSIAPLDEELIERMRHCEAIFMRMAQRYAQAMGYAISGTVPYNESKRLYLNELRYWNHLLDTKHIDLVVMYHIPHQGYDYILYNLCKLKGIPVVHLDHLFMVDSIFAVEDWEDSVVEVRDALQHLREQYKDPATPIPLSRNYEYYFQYYRGKKLAPWYQAKQSIFAKQSFLLKWWRRALKVLRRNPRQFFSTLASQQFWSRKIREHRTIRFYNRHVTVPDLNKPFIYLALHCQPEASTLPEAGAFMDQELIAQLIATYLPAGVSLYVKEHPGQGERFRSVEFYQSLLAIPAVSFIPKETDTYELIDRCIAVATATGTVGFEAIMRQKPVLMFGHFFTQYGPGSFSIRTAEDCRKALEQIFSRKESHTVRDVRLFLKAVEQCATPYPGPPDSPFEEHTQDEKAEHVGALIQRKIRSVMAAAGAARNH